MKEKNIHYIYKVLTKLNFASLMTMPFLKKIFLACALCLIFSELHAQDLLSDRREEIELTKEALDHIYNFEFEEAEQYIENLETKVPDHPGLSLLRALLIYWENFPLKVESEERIQYESFLNQSAAQAEVLLDENEDDVEGIFFTLAAYGYLTSFYAEEGNIFKALGYAKKAYSSFKSKPAFSDE